jgi:hypothetical protein
MMLSLPTHYQGHQVFIALVSLQATFLGFLDERGVVLHLLSVQSMQFFTA